MADVTEQIAQIAPSPLNSLIDERLVFGEAAGLSAGAEDRRLVLVRTAASNPQMAAGSAGVIPRPVRTRPNPDFCSKYSRIRRLYKGGCAAGGRRLSIEEFGPLNLLPCHGRHYARTDHVDRLRATYSRRGGVRHMYGA